MKKIAMFCNVAADAVFQSIDVDTDLRAAARARTSRASTTSSPSCSTSGRARRGSTAWEERRRADRPSRRRKVDDRLRRQVRRSSSSRTRASTRRCIHGGIAQRLPRRDPATSTPRRSSSSGAAALLADVDGILVAPGFGARGTEGKIAAVRYAREKQRAVLRHLLRHAAGGDRVRAPRVRPRRGANSTEIDPATPHPVVDLMPDQRGVTDKGATMRLGAYPCVLNAGHARRRGLRRDRDQRAPPPPLGGQQRLPRRARAARHGALGAVARRPAGRDDRAAAAPVLRGAASSTPSSSRGRRRRTRCSSRSSRAALAAPASGDAHGVAPGRQPAAARDRAVVSKLALVTMHAVSGRSLRSAGRFVCDRVMCNSCTTSRH